MLKQTVTTVAAASLLTVALVAQQKPAPSPARPAAAPAPKAAQPTPAREESPAPVRAAEPAGQPLNVKLDITITDQGASSEPSRKTVSMVVADRAAGSIRTGGTVIPTVNGAQPLTINVDATPTILRDGSIRMLFGLEYQPRPITDAAQANVVPSRMSQVNQRLAVILQDGKPLVISQAADAASDRKITVELRATIAK